MSQMASAAAVQQALVDEGCRVVGLAGWDRHNRDGGGRAPNQPNGIINHHTGSDTSNPALYAASVLWAGRSDLPGPLCDGGIAPDGTIYLVGHGRTNHAGGGDPAVLDVVIANAAPFDRELRPRYGNTTPGRADGNAHFHGWEVMYSGGHAMTPAQYVATVKANAALCRLYPGWNAGSSIAHREWSSDKPDPGVVYMPNFRKDVAACLALPPGVWRGAGTPKPSNPTTSPTSPTSSTKTPAPPAPSPYVPEEDTVDRPYLITVDEKAWQLVDLNGRKMAITSSSDGNALAAYLNASKLPVNSQGKLSSEQVARSLQLLEDFYALEPLPGSPAALALATARDGSPSTTPPSSDAGGNTSHTGAAA